MTRKVPANSLHLADGTQPQITALAIYPDGQPLATPGGHPVETSNTALIEHMMTELQEFGYLDVSENGSLEIRELCTYTLWCSKRDFLDSADWQIDPDSITSLAQEPIFDSTPGPEMADQLYAWDPIQKFFDQHELPFFRSPTHIDTDLPEYKKLKLVFGELHNSLSAEQVAVYRCLSTATTQIIPPLLFAAGFLTANEFANAIVASTPSHVAFGFPSEGDKTPEEVHAETTRTLRGFASRCEVFLKLSVDPIFDLIKKGETKRCEFKSTMRFNLRSKQHDINVISHAVLKTIAAFLNSEGGNLIIGVRDDGTTIGIEEDQFQNVDKWQLHLSNLVRDKLGTSALSHIDTRIIPSEGKTIAEITCKKSPDEIYLRMSKNSSEEFYIRSGPSSTLLQPSEIVKYLRVRPTT